eukprot:TRINITY_DN20439_c0_g1_i2.p2 TRINITY_DN20439_c0_g1~~TRINITY_DN20439_c0_g1_i2.p2  ORF type:complete len:126 (+),score=38.90 TRINITY_DN20439_c0_g1_i2:30-380(+)
MCIRDSNLQIEKGKNIRSINDFQTKKQELLLKIQESPEEFENVAFTLEYHTEFQDLSSSKRKIPCTFLKSPTNATKKISPTFLLTSKSPKNAKKLESKFAIIPKRCPGTFLSLIHI